MLTIQQRINGIECGLSVQQGLVTSAGYPANKQWHYVQTARQRINGNKCSYPAKNQWH